MDAERLRKMRWAAPLLPEPGPEVVIELLDEIELMRSLLAEVVGWSITTSRGGVWETGFDREGLDTEPLDERWWPMLDALAKDASDDAAAAALGGPDEQ